MVNMVSKEKHWNPVVEVIKDIKVKVKSKYGSIPSDSFEEWLLLLDDDYYTDMFAPLQVNQKGDMLLIRYGVDVMKEGMWSDPDSIYRECRSVVINLDTEEVVIAPFRKFFNLNEVEENHVDKIREKFSTAKEVYVLDKLDGSMQNARWYNNEILLVGSMALSEEDSWRLKEGKRLLTENYKEMMKTLPTWTFTFEYVSPINLHVVPYDVKDEGMYLLGIRDTDTGVQMSVSSVMQIAHSFGVKVPKMEQQTLDELLEKMETVPSYEKEGWVVNLDGHIVKLKCDDYVKIHRALDVSSSVNVVIQSLAENTYDDLISKVPPYLRGRIEAIAKLVTDYMRETHKEVTEWYFKLPKGDLKEVMVFISNNVPKDLQGHVRNKYKGITNNYLLRGKRGYKKMKDLGYSEADVAQAIKEVTLDGKS